MPEAYVARLSAYISQTLPLKHKFALCHGTRSGREQSWFRKYLPSGVEVWGTEISEAAAKVAPYTIAWDYHKVKPEWRGRVDFVVSLSVPVCLDHGRFACSLRRGAAIVVFIIILELDDLVSAAT